MLPARHECGTRALSGACPARNSWLRQVEIGGELKPNDAAGRLVAFRRTDIILIKQKLALCKAQEA
jgi:hypothetical protein